MRHIPNPQEFWAAEMESLLADVPPLTPEEIARGLDFVFDLMQELETIGIMLPMADYGVIGAYLNDARNYLRSV